jgi:hypothetical protein
MTPPTELSAGKPSEDRESEGHDVRPALVAWKDDLHEQEPDHRAGDRSDDRSENPSENRHRPSKAPIRAADKGRRR